MTDPTLTLQKKNNEKKRTQNLRPFLLKKFQKTIDFYTPMEYTKIIKGTTKQKRKVEII